MTKKKPNPKPEAYDPQEGYRYQILCRNQSYGGRAWEHCDYAVDRWDKKFLIGEYRLAYPAGYEFQSIQLPKKYWPKGHVAADTYEEHLAQKKASNPSKSTRGLKARLLK